MNKKLISILFAIIAIFCISTMSFAADMTKDYSTVTEFASKYSHGTIFWTEDTKIEKITCGSISTSNWDGELYRTNPSASIAMTIAGQTGHEDVSFKITNCAIDNDGDLCDVIFTSDGTPFTKSPSSFTQYNGALFGYSDTSVTVPAASCIRNEVRVSKGNPGDLVKMSFQTNFASAKVTIKYVKAGTNTPANIQGTVGTFFDLDVPNKDSDFNSQLFNGCEGISINGYGGTVYFKKGIYNYATSDGNGVQTPYGKEMADNPWTDDNKINLYNSAVATIDMKNGAAGFTYSGKKCGIQFLFASPFAFELDNPTKKVSKNVATDGDKFTYTISQYVPNNYYTSTYTFLGTSYNGIYSDFVISDTLDENLIIDKNNITITNSKGEDVKAYFDVVFDNNKITATVKENILGQNVFYNECFNINIPVTVKEGTGKKVKVIDNKASTKYELNGEDEELPSNEVETELQYKFEVTTEIDDGGTISDDYSTVVKCGENGKYIVEIEIKDGYQINTITVDGKEISVDDLTKESDGKYSYTFEDKNITEDIKHEIKVTTERKRADVIAKYVDEDGNEISDSILKSYNVFDEYTTSSKEIDKYELVRVDGEETGIVPEDGVEVVYVYKKVKADVIAKYVDEDGNEISDSILKTYKIGEEYTTSPKELKGYKLVRVDGEKTGIVTKDGAEVVYVYKKIPAIINTGDMTTVLPYMVISIVCVILTVALLTIKKKFGESK